MGKLVAGPVCGLCRAGRVREAGAGGAVVAGAVPAGVVRAGATVVRATGTVAGVGNVRDAPPVAPWRLANGLPSATGLAAVLTYPGAVTPGAIRSGPPVEDLTDTNLGAIIMGRTAPCGATVCLGTGWGTALGTGGCAGITILYCPGRADLGHRNMPVQPGSWAGSRLQPKAHRVGNVKTRVGWCLGVRTRNIYLAKGLEPMWDPWNTGRLWPSVLLISEPLGDTKDSGFL